MDSDRLKVKRWTKIFSANSKQDDSKDGYNIRLEIKIDFNLRSHSPLVGERGGPGENLSQQDFTCSETLLN